MIMTISIMIVSMIIIIIIAVVVIIMIAMIVIIIATVVTVIRTTLTVTAARRFFSIRDNNAMSVSVFPSVLRAASDQCRKLPLSHAASSQLIFHRGVALEERCLIYPRPRG